MVEVQEDIENVCYYDIVALKEHKKKERREPYISELPENCVGCGGTKYDKDLCANYSPVPKIEV